MIDNAPITPSVEQLPTPQIKPKKNRPSLIWLIPIVAALAGGWIGLQAFLHQGPNITISFLSANGIESGKTKVKYKDVVIGTVSNVSLSDDHQRVTVTANMTHGSDDLFGEGARFWVVRPMISGGTVSGLNTLLSGAYIALDPAKKSDKKRAFTGLESQPVITSNQPGREFTLKAQNMGSISTGTPIFFRRMQVGEVSAFKLDPSGEFISISIFVHAPYDQFVTSNSRFWHAGGFDLSLSSNGLNIETQSVVSMLVGGLAFQSPPGEDIGAVAADNSIFTLADNKVAAMKSAEHSKLPFVIYFKDSVRGLSIGAPVDFRGIQVGEVQSINMELSKAADIHIPVTIEIYPERFRSLEGKILPSRAYKEQKRIINALIQKGLRAQIRTGNLLTGQLYIALDYIPNAKSAQVDWSHIPPKMPSMNGSLNEIQSKIASIVSKIDHMPLEAIGENANETIKKLNATIESSHQLLNRIDKEIIPSAKTVLVDAKNALNQVQGTLQPESPLQQNLEHTLQEFAKAAQSLRTLSDYLNRHPEALIQGRAEESK